MSTKLMANIGPDDLGRYCFVIPHFNHSAQFHEFLQPLVQSKISCVVIDDGSESAQKQAISSLVADVDNLYLYEHSNNRGKGAAVATGCTHARHLGFTHIIQIDADGQHNPMDAYRLIEASKKEPAALISGNPQFDKSAPRARLYGRKITTFFVALETASFTIKDALCGFRVYPLDTFEHLYDNYHIGSRMDFDTDIIVKANWAGFPIRFIDTDVCYIPDGVSHFHYIRDNLRLIKLHSRLLVQACFRIPKKILTGHSR